MENKGSEMAKKSLSRFAEALRNGKVVAFPTETVYGLGASAWNADAIARVFTLKGRPPDNPLIVHINSTDMLDSLVLTISEDATKLFEAFWPGPLTLIFPKKPEVLDIVTAGIPTVAVRMPDHPVPLRLIAESGPLAAPSANTSGRPSPTRAEHVLQDFGNEIPVIEGGVCQYGLESTVLDLTSEPYTILRPGHVTQSELEQVLGKPVRVHSPLPVDENGAAPRSPGMKYTHYAPNATVRWMDPEEVPAEQDTHKTLYLLHQCEPHVEWTSKSGQGAATASAPDTHIKRQIHSHIIHYQENYLEMARELYDRFRMADLKGYSEISIEPFSLTEETTVALRNRIMKAISTEGR
ncbi:L-threonylcarbamoyladenylate synthase [Balneolaceae bacterium ANBcel3]|nr:L-threonylcarbamoyladenylate synthase [Balneolaceae bacterium ANBcel3]